MISLGRRNTTGGCYVRDPCNRTIPFLRMEMNYLDLRKSLNYCVCQGLWPLQSEKRAPGNTNAHKETQMHAGKCARALHFFGIFESKRFSQSQRKEKNKRFDFFAYEVHDPWHTQYVKECQRKIYTIVLKAKKKFVVQ
jgi:hypothetical protein